ncbi:hypothetical protein BDP27DRAFT_1214171, partial [Rhodocollybia butyracea]
LTTRQAVLASVVDSSHVALGNTNKKKKVLNESELALRREENARKRKNLSEKRLEDEKLETINRLLKKQSRPRAKRADGAEVEDVEGEEVEGVEGSVGSDQSKGTLGPVVPMFRWVSTTIPVPSEVAAPVQLGIQELSSGTVPVVPQEKQMRMYLAIPAAFLPPSENLADTVTSFDGPPRVPTPGSRPPAICAISGCESPRKYRLVRDWRIGACGMVHLKALEGISGQN